jgi:protein O-GlcNAc transferase
VSRHKHSLSRAAVLSSGPVKKSDQLLRQADDKVRAGQHAAAADLYRQCTVLQPTNAAAFYNLGCCLQAIDDFWNAADAFRTSIALKPTAEAHVNLAEALRRQADWGGAMHQCDAALALSPRNAEAHVVRGTLLGAAGRQDEALVALETAVRHKPTHPDARLQLGTRLAAAGRFVDAAAHLEKAEALRPGHVPTLILLSETYRGSGRTWDAFGAIRKASELEPRNARIYNNMAAILASTTMLDMAASAARLALDLAPDLAPAAFNLGMILMTQGKDQEAIAAYSRAVEIEPTNGEALFQLVKLHERSCDWEGLEIARELARSMTYRSGRRAAPFAVLSLAASPYEHLMSARTFAKSLINNTAAPLAGYEPRDRTTGRLRVGYLSSDFHMHATADLIAEVFELHDKTTIETFGYSMGVDDKSPMRARLIASLDHFHDIQALGHQDAAKAIFDDKIDILVDLKGYTQNCRAEILALRPAPVQVNFLGYPGTMGAPFIDYVVADPHVAPFDHARFYDEKIVHLPHSYQPNDRKRLSVRRSEPRSAHGLPETGFVFCCFNNTYKISSEIFDVWMRLLIAVPDSILWLLKNNDRVEATLRREAEARGVSGARLVFAPRVPSARHLARVSLADLFLDTLLYNAHTTASEALWVGVPVVTLIGEAFPARVGASLLRACDLPDLVTETLADYEAMALRLATDSDALAAVNARLLQARETAPLFDAPLFTRHLEAAYRGMAERLAHGDAPSAFAVAAIEP